MTRWAAALVYLFCFALCTPSLAIPVISVGSATAHVGDTFTIPISIADATPDLTSWQFDLSFNPTILQGISVGEGPFMSSFGATTFSPGVIDNTAGLISLVTNSYIDLPPNPTGSGVLADITFRALVRGGSPLTLTNVFLNLNDQDSGGFGVVNGNAQAVPEPNSLALLLGLALAAFGLRCRLLQQRNRCG